jgi:type IV pilus assembly protein PilV
MMNLKRNKAKGFSLLEVLVAIVLITLGFLSMLALQASSMQYSSMAYYRGIASQVGNGLAASIRANPDGLSSYNYTYSAGAAVSTPGCQNSYTCGTAQIAASDIAWARQSARAQLPEGDLQVKSGSDFVDVILVWQEPASKGTVDLGSCAGTGISGITANTQCLSMRVKI